MKLRYFSLLIFRVYNNKNNFLVIKWIRHAVSVWHWSWQFCYRTITSSKWNNNKNSYFSSPPLLAEESETNLKKNTENEKFRRPFFFLVSDSRAQYKCGVFLRETRDNWTLSVLSSDPLVIARWILFKPMHTSQRWLFSLYWWHKEPNKNCVYW